MGLAYDEFYPPNYFNNLLKDLQAILASGANIIFEKTVLAKMQ